MNKELKQHIKFCYKETLSTYRGLFTIEKIKQKAFENIKKHLDYEEKQGRWYWKIDDKALFTFINNL